MPEMSRLAQRWCRSSPWRVFAGHVVLPWALQRVELRGDVLEIGCGSGAMAAEVLRKFPDVTLTATDYDQSMVQAAGPRLSEFGERAMVSQADATALPFSTASFDVVLTFIMLHHVLHWEQALAEAVRVLRPGGRLVGYDLLGDGAGRIVNRHDRNTRLMRKGELRQVLDELAVDEAVVKPAFGSLAARFRVVKPAT